jgi:hypothetical protein
MHLCVMREADAVVMREAVMREAVMREAVMREADAVVMREHCMI